MNILTFTTLFPNRDEPSRGVFVKERVRHFQDHASLKVVVPISVYTKARLRRNGKISPREERIAGLDVRHPTYFYFPGMFKAADGFLLFLSSVRILAAIRKDFPFDMIDAHYAYPDGYAAVLLGKLFRVPVSITLRGNDVTLLPTFRARRWFVKRALEHADLLIAVSGGLMRKASEVLGREKEIHVVMNSVDQDAFRIMDRTDARRELGIDDDGRIILSVGALIERKGFHYLIEAFASLPDEVRKDAKVYIVGGSGGEKNHEPVLKKLVRQHGLEDRVVFWGPSSHGELLRIYNAADLFCLFSEREGCPNVLMEAIACGLPSVVCGDWADRRMIPGDEIGYIVSSRDPSVLGKAIRKALDAGWDRERIRGYSLENSWRTVAEKTMALYRDIAG